MKDSVDVAVHVRGPLCKGLLQMDNIYSESRRNTLWTDSSNATGRQKFIDKHNQENYYDKQPKVRNSDEWEFLNLMEAERCSYCGSEDISRFGYTVSHIRRFRCGRCRRTFTVLTGTVFDSHKIPISEWIEFCLAIFREQSFTSASKTNKNSYATTRYSCFFYKPCNDKLKISPD